MDTVSLRKLVFFTLECLYFLCFVHSHFISFGMNIPEMKSNFIFPDRDIVTGKKYINSLFDQNCHFFFHFLSYIGLNMFYLITVPGMHL